VNRRPNVLLIDMGGVLLDLGTSQGVPEGAMDWRGRQALLNRLRRSGAHLDLDDLDRLLFTPWREQYEKRYERGREERWEPHFHRLRRETGARGRTLKFLASWFRPFAESLESLPGALNAVKTLRVAGYRLGVVSNVPLPGVLYRRVLKRTGLEAAFADFRFSYDEDSRKPSPAMLRAALDALDAVPAKAWMVGDRRSSDVAAGRAAGLTTVWVRSEYTEGPQPDHVVDRLADVPALVAQQAG
jgi:HAD superfamily hydrolase (TIGR01662 family)